MTSDQYSARLMALMDVALTKGPGLRAVVNETIDMVTDYICMRSDDPDQMIEITIKRMLNRVTADA